MFLALKIGAKMNFGGDEGLCPHRLQKSTMLHFGTDCMLYCGKHAGLPGTDLGVSEACHWKFRCGPPPRSPPLSDPDRGSASETAVRRRKHAGLPSISILPQKCAPRKGHTNFSGSSVGNKAFVLKRAQQRQNGACLIAIQHGYLRLFPVRAGTIGCFASNKV